MSTKKTTKTKPYISLIIPAYKQEKTIQKDLRYIISVLNSIRFSYELIVVIDGKMDQTFQKASMVRSPYLKVIGYTNNHGKGFAIRYGTVRARGKIVGFLDAGMDLKPNGIAILLEHFEWYNADIIVGSKLHPVSKVKYPYQRRILSWGYRFLTRLLFGLSVRDTQVGMKFFKRSVLKDILPRLLVKTYAFDIEMLAVAYSLGYRRIYEAPVELDFQGVSSIASKGFWKVALLMLWDTLAVFYRLKILHYYDNTSKNKWVYDSELQFRVNLP